MKDCTLDIRCVFRSKHIRTVPGPIADATPLTAPAKFSDRDRVGETWGENVTPKAIWNVVKTAAQRAGIQNLAPRDLRRTCARLRHMAGGELVQIQFLLGHASVQTTERDLGCKQIARCRERSDRYPGSLSGSFLPQRDLGGIIFQCRRFGVA